MCAATVEHYSLDKRATSESSSIYQTRFANVTWDNENWRLTTTDLDQGHYQSRITVANGYHGINVAALGPFFEVDTPVNGDNINGWPLHQRRQTFATVGGFFDSQPDLNSSNFDWLKQYGWDSAISGIPHWGGILVDLGDAVLNAGSNKSTISNFSSTSDMAQGLMNWQYTWSPSGHGSFNITYQMFAHKLNVTQGFVSLNITAQRDTNMTIVNVLNGDCAVRTTPGQKGIDGGIIYTSVQPDGIKNVTAFVYAGMEIDGAQVLATQQGNWNKSYIGGNQSSIATGINVTLQAGETATFIKYVGIASTDGYPQPQAVARNAALSGRSNGYDAALSSHVAEWSQVFHKGTVDDFSYPENGTLPNDDYIIEAQITAIANPYYLLSNTVSQNALIASGNATINSHSISVSGLGSDSYAGQVFWDAEVWMQPGLVAAFPFAGRQIANYRVARYEQAKANTKTAYQSSQNKTYISPDAAIYPWTSGRFGNCTGTGPCFDYEYHINGDIGLEFTNYWVTSGDTEYFKDELFPIYKSLATLYSNLLEKNGSHWSLTNITDPDEYAGYVDNGGFTQPLVAEMLNNANAFSAMFNQSQNSTWTTQAQNILIDRNEDANIILEFSGMNGTIVVKQADVVLVTYPLSYTGENYSATDSLSDLDYYAAKQSIDGPGMTYAIFSIIANQVSPSGCSSYTYQQYSSQPYMRGPWFQFSEQLIDDASENGGTDPAYPFLTGHGGANQVILFGYLGLRLVPDGLLHIDPSLPPQIPQLRYRTFYWQGWPISAFSNQTHTTLTRNASIAGDQGAFPNATFASSPISVAVGAIGGNRTNYSLPPNGSITITNRQIGLNKTTPGNLAQCQAVTSTSSYLPGQFPIAAVDGASSTKWQPTFANETANITVNLPVGHKVVGFTFDWAQAPPYNYSIAFHNNSDSSDAVTVSHNDSVGVSSSIDTATANNIMALSSNTTVVQINETLYTSRYATLSIWGSHSNGTLTAKNMSGDGATVAEWNILVQDELEKRSFEGNLVGINDALVREQLGKLGRYSRATRMRMGLPA